MQRKTKVRIIVLITLLLTLLGCLLIYFMQPAKLNAQNFEFELGSEVIISEKILFKQSDKVEIINIDEPSNYDEAKAYQIEVHYKYHQKEHTTLLTIVITDKTAPKIELIRESIVIGVGEVDVDYLKYFSVQDYSDYSINIDDSQVLYNEVGIYPIIIEVTDIFENKSNERVEVEVKPKLVDPESSELTIVDGVLIVNKKNSVPKDYGDGANEEAVMALNSLIQDMQQLGLDVSNNVSGYRDYAYQEKLYNKYVQQYGVEWADTYSARPGFSEHQTGLAFDLKNQNGQLIESELEATWIKENAHKYGFVVRYPYNKDHITGYKHEPWHLRYVGELATLLHNANLTLEEYFNVEGGDYN